MSTVLSVAAYLERLRLEGQLLAAAAERTGGDAAIAACPGWRMRDLVRHTGCVHRWAAAHVRDQLTTGQEFSDTADVVAGLPDYASLLDWFVEGHAALVDTLATADPDVACWAFLPAATPLLFWARRQTHETTIHRVDAEQSAGTVAPVAPRIAADGIDELLTGFAARRRGRLRSTTPRILAVHATDTGDHWSVHIGTDPVRTTRERAASADTTVSATAHDLYLKLWNRRPADRLDVTGDPALLELWQDRVQIG